MEAGVKEVMVGKDQMVVIVSGEEMDEEEVLRKAKQRKAMTEVLEVHIPLQIIQNKNGNAKKEEKNEEEEGCGDRTAVENKDENAKQKENKKNNEELETCNAGDDDGNSHGDVCEKTKIKRKAVCEDPLSKGALDNSSSQCPPSKVENPASELPPIKGGITDPDKKPSGPKWKPPAPSVPGSGVSGTSLIGLPPPSTKRPLVRGDTLVSERSSYDASHSVMFRTRVTTTHDACTCIRFEETRFHIDKCVTHQC